MAIQIECDRCEKVFAVTPDKAGTKVPCPHCGDINRVPAAGATHSAALPPDSGPEVVIRTVRPAMFRAHPFRYVFILALVLGGFGFAAVAAMGERWPAWAPWPSLAVGVIGVGWFLYWWVFSTLWIRLTLSNKRIVRAEGIIRRDTSEVMHDHVRNVAIRQTFLQRIFRVGYLGIASAGHEGIEIEIRDIPDPDRVKAIIDQYRK